jgi:Prolyl oligopeptidase family
VPVGIISDIKWRKDSSELAFNFKSSRTPNDVYSVNPQTGTVEHWVTTATDPSKFSEPELVHWPTFDKRTLSGFIYRPSSNFNGKRPVIIDMHGGPEEQYRPGFGYDNNYFLNELGIARIYPNVRGSSGYGKAFLRLDDGLQREDAVKDIGALLDWIKTQPDLDADRVLVEGASYAVALILHKLDQVPVVPFGRRHGLIGVVKRRLPKRMIVPFDAGDLTGLATDAGRYIDVLADFFFAARPLAGYRTGMGRDFLNLKSLWITHLICPTNFSLSPSLSSRLLKFLIQTSTN